LWQQLYYVSKEKVLSFIFPLTDILSMLKDFNINYLIVVFVSGAIFLAALYHTILYFHRKTKLLLSYSLYLWVTFIYAFFRVVLFTMNAEEHSFFLAINADESIQMLAFMLYVQFAGVAMDLDEKQDKAAIFFVKITPWLILTYIIFQIVVVNAIGVASLFFIALIAIRFYLLLMGLIMLLIVLRRKRLIYYRYLGGGAIAMIVFGLISSLVRLYPENEFIIAPLSWLMAGFFADVVFFSSAIGYRIKQEATEKEAALTMVLNQQDKLQQKELEQLKLVYQTREDERHRIAKDLHDDVGATLSGIRMFSQLAGERPANSYEYLEKINNYSGEMLKKMNDIIWSLSTENSNIDQLVARLRNDMVTVTAAGNIVLDFWIDDSLKEVVPEINLRKNIYLLIKEAINNALKHAGCKSIKVSIRSVQVGIMVEVTDDGKGFDVTVSSAGNGLMNMRRRTEEINGEFTISSAPGQGTVVKAVFISPDWG